MTNQDTIITLFNNLSKSEQVETLTALNSFMRGEDAQELCDDTTIVDDVIGDCLHSLEDGEEYNFNEPIHLADGTIAKKFWVDDGNEDVRIEIWQTEPTDAWRDDAFLSSMETKDAVKVAKAISTYWD
jgi:hypothetical protein